MFRSEFIGMGLFGFMRKSEPDQKEKLILENLDWIKKPENRNVPQFLSYRMNRTKVAATNSETFNFQFKVSQDITIKKIFLNSRYTQTGLGILLPPTSIRFTYDGIVQPVEPRFTGADVSIQNNIITLGFSNSNEASMNLILRGSTANSEVQVELLSFSPVVPLIGDSTVIELAIEYI